MAGISHVFTISRVAEMLGEDEALLQEISIDMHPEDGRFTVLGPGRAVRGKSGIAEPQLVGGELWFALTWIDRRRLVDCGDRPSREQELRDEFGEAQYRYFHAVHARRDAQQQIGDHRGEDLQADSVVVGTEEFTDIEMLLDPAEQQFNLPAALVKRRNLDRRA